MSPIIKRAAIGAAAFAGVFALAEAAMSPPPSCRLVAMRIEAAAAAPAPADVDPRVAQYASNFMRGISGFVLREGRSLNCIRALIGA